MKQVIKGTIPLLPASLIAILMLTSTSIAMQDKIQPEKENITTITQDNTTATQKIKKLALLFYKVCTINYHPLLMQELISQSKELLMHPDFTISIKVNNITREINALAQSFFDACSTGNITIINVLINNFKQELANPNLTIPFLINDTTTNVQVVAQAFLQAYQKDNVTIVKNSIENFKQLLLDPTIKAVMQPENIVKYENDLEIEDNIEKNNTIIRVFLLACYEGNLPMAKLIIQSLIDQLSTLCTSITITDLEKTNNEETVDLIAFSLYQAHLKNQKEITAYLLKVIVKHDLTTSLTSFFRIIEKLNTFPKFIPLLSNAMDAAKKSTSIQFIISYWCSKKMKEIEKMIFEEFKGLLKKDSSKTESKNNNNSQNQNKTQKPSPHVSDSPSFPNQSNFHTQLSRKIAPIVSDLMPYYTILSIYMPETFSSSFFEEKK